MRKFFFYFYYGVERERKDKEREKDAEKLRKCEKELQKKDNSVRCHLQRSLLVKEHGASYNLMVRL